MSNNKDKKKIDNIKKKNKTPDYKFQSNIEFLINIRDILEERIFDTKIEFFLNFF